MAQPRQKRTASHAPGVKRPGLDRTESVFLVCESGRRWSDAARRFVGPFQHADRTNPSIDESPLDAAIVIVKPVPLEKVRASLSGTASAAVLWELSEQNAAKLSLTVAQIGFARPDVLQFVALHQDAIKTGKALGIQMMQFGVRGVVSSPEEFAAFSQLVHRRFTEVAYRHW